MKCSRRSTTWLASALLALAAAAGRDAWAQGASDPLAVSLESEIRQAVIAAVKGKMGQDATVRIDELTMRARGEQAGGALIASPEPAARLGRTIRFTLARKPANGGAPIPAGFAVAQVFVAVEHVRSTRPMGRGETCEAIDLAVVDSDVGAVPLQRLPRKSDIVGAQVLRPLGESQVVTRTAVTVRPAVQSGDVVTVQAAAGAVVVEGRAVAAQSGAAGDTIRVVNKDSRRALRARVLGPGRVEVLQ